MSPAWPGKQAADGILAPVRLLPVAPGFHGSEYSTGIRQQSRNDRHGKRNGRLAVEPDDLRHRPVLGGGWQMVARVSGTSSWDTNMGTSPARDATELRHA
jgi:hypothetical protein